MSSHKNWHMQLNFVIPVPLVWNVELKSSVWSLIRQSG